MARITDAILGQAYSVNNTAPMLDLTFGGQQGYAPNLAEWVSNQAYVRRNLICILLEAPKVFSLFPNPEKWVQSLKSLMELHVKTIEGFNAGLSVEFDEHPVGGAGEMQQEVINVKRARSEPVFGFVEKYGRPIQTLLDYWIRYGMQDPDTKFALASTLGKHPDDMLADWFTMTCLFIEPDVLHRKVTQAWVTTNMMPKSNGEIIGKRDLTSDLEILNLSIEFTGISQYGKGVDLFAQNILDRINIEGADPHMRPSFIQDMDSEVAGAQVGYETTPSDIGDNAVASMG